MNKLLKKLVIIPVLLGIVACNSSNGASSNVSSSSTNKPTTSSTTNHISSSSTTTVKEEWTVSFMYNYEGNSERFDYQYVQDGEKAVKPVQRPTRDEHKFTNWYKDPECTILFDFDTEVITGPTYIYAGWREVEDPSKGFDINWTRVGGVLYSSLDGSQLPSHVDAYTKISFTITILDTHEGAPIVRANDTQLMPKDGVYSLTVNTKTTINVTGIKLKEVIDGSTTVTVPNEFFLSVNDEIEGTMTTSAEIPSDAITQYEITLTLEVDDKVVIVDGDGKEYKNWENGGEFIANTPVIVTTPGDYTFYLKVYESRISIWISKPLDPSLEYMTVYYTNPNNWSTVYAYAWVGAGDAYMGQWPGKAMSYDSATGYYYMENVVVGENIIFNNGSGAQTDDLKVPTDGKNVFSTFWFTLGGDSTPTPTPTPDPTGEYYRFTFTLPSGWDPAPTNPRVHYWGSANTENVNLFELGAQSNMTLLEGSTYYIEIDTSITLDGMILIIDQGSEVKQSIDITTLPTTAGNYEFYVDWSANWELNSSNVFCFVASVITAQ